MSKGFTLIELVIVIGMQASLILAVVYTYHGFLSAWQSAEVRTGLQIPVDRAVDDMARELREAVEVRQNNNYEIRFTRDYGSGNVSAIYYLYNPLDGYPPLFNQSSYDLYRANLTGGINGSFTYGQEQAIVYGVVSPHNATTNLTVYNATVGNYTVKNVALIDLNFTRQSETFRVKAEVMPRNLLP